MFEIVISANSELMITMEILIYPVLALMLLFLIYGMLGQYHELPIRNVTTNVNFTVDKCASEHCVRCHKYKTIIKTVSDRFKDESALLSIARNCGERIVKAITSLDPDRKFQASDRQQPNILLVEGLTAKPFWSDEEFVSDIVILESEINTIIGEFEHVYNNVWPNGWLVNTTPEGEWAVFHLINQGAHVKSNCDKCPKTYELLKNLVYSMSQSGNIFANVSFSVVQSGTVISPHYGPTNVRIRCHLGLRTSDPQTSYLTVSEERGTWDTGKCLIFDDSFLHEVHHADRDEASRAVLLIDMWHPDLNDTEKDLINNLFKFKRTRTNLPNINIPVNIVEL